MTEESRPSVADGVARPLDPRSIHVQRLAGTIGVATLSSAGLLGVMILLLGGPGSRLRSAALLASWLLGTLAAATFALWWPAVRYRHVTWRLDDRGFQIRSGVWWRSVVDVPHSRVQHTDVQQGPIERSFELATLILHTAGTQHAAIPLSGLEHAVALAIRDHLLRDGGRRPADA